MKYSIPFAASLMVLTVQTAYAQVEEEVIVTATRGEIAVSEALASVNVLTRADINRAQASDITELLGRLPGIDVDSNGGRGSNSSIRMRGGESDHVLILIDGVRTSSATNGATALQQIPLALIERVEVVRGPRASLYGSEAIGGVIQLFTRSGKNSQSSFEPVLRAEYGSHNTVKLNAGFQGKQDGTAYSLHIGSDTTDGIDRIVGSTGPDTDDDGYEETSILASISHVFENKASIEAIYSNTDSETEFDSGANDLTDGTNQHIVVRGLLPVSENITLQAEVASYNDEQTTSGSFPNLFETTRDSYQLQANFNLNDNGALVAGYESYVDEVSSSDTFTQDERDNSAIYGFYSNNLGAARIELGARQDDNEAFGKTSTGNAAVGFDVSETVALTVSYGTAFKAPTFNDLYYPFQDFGGGFSFVGNPNLEPEESDTLELRAEGNVGEATWGLSVYKTEVENLIVSTATTVENRLEAELTGAELSISYKIAGWQTDAGLSYVDAVDANTESRLTNRARGQATLDLSRDFGDFNLEVSWQASGGRTSSGNQLAGYSTTDVRGSYQIDEGLSAGFNVKNLFDKDYTLVSGFSGDFRTEGTTVAVFIQYAL